MMETFAERVIRHPYLEREEKISELIAMGYETDEIIKMIRSFDLSVEMQLDDLLDPEPEYMDV